MLLTANDGGNDGSRRPGWVALLHRLTRIGPVAPGHRLELSFDLLGKDEEFLIKFWTLEFVSEPPSLLWRANSRARLLLNGRSYADVLGIERLDPYAMTPAYADPRSLEKATLLIPRGFVAEVSLEMPSLVSAVPIMRVELHGWLYRREYDLQGEDDLQGEGR